MTFGTIFSKPLGIFKECFYIVIFPQKNEQTLGYMNRIFKMWLQLENYSRLTRKFESKLQDGCPP
jgi:hypothetical protein